MKKENRERKNDIKEINVITLDEQQKEAKRLIYNFPITIITGISGSGKTFVAAQCAEEMLYKKMTNVVKVVRPTVVVGRSLGHLPGTLEEKLSPYFFPFVDNLYMCSNNKERVKMQLEQKIIDFGDIQHIRGKTFNHLVVLDESQNTTEEEMEAVITRNGKEGKLIILGDLKQKDIKGGNNGLAFALKASEFLPNINHVHLLYKNYRHDVVRELLEWKYGKENL